MLAKTLLTVEDLAALVAGVFEYNSRGQVRTLIFTDGDGKQVNVAYMEAVCEVPGLAVRIKPEDTTQSDLDRQLYPPIGDPRKVQQPATLGQLKALAEV